MNLASFTPLYAMLDGVAMKMEYIINLSSGLPDLAIFCVTWKLQVNMLGNDCMLDPTIVENLLMSISKGNCAKLLSLSSYEQTPSGFNLMFRPHIVDSQYSDSRRYLRHISLTVDFVYPPTDVSQTLFWRMLVLLDYGLTSLYNELRQLAPLVFQSGEIEKYQLGSCISSLSRSIGVESGPNLVIGIERRLFTHTPSIKWNCSDLIFAGVTYYQVPDYTVILDEDAEYAPQLVTMSELDVLSEPGSDGWEK